MKNYLKAIIFASLSLGVLTGCEDFLERNPHDRVTDNTFWKTKADAEQGLTACYACLHSSPLFNIHSGEFDCLTDNGFNKDGGFTNIYLGNLNSQTGNICGSMYYNSYASIARFNELIFRVSKMDFSEEEKNRILGEGRFLRGMYYFYLTQLYGGLPLITEPYQIGDELLPRTSREDILKFVKDDLDFAIDHLADKPYTDGHAGKGAAKLMKVRVLMAQQNFAEASKLAKSIMNGTFKLADNYKTIFETSGQQNNPEIMFSTKYLAPLFRNDAPVFYGWWMRVNPYQSFVGTFECTDGKSIEESPLYDSKNPYDNRDPRLFYTVVCPGSEWGYAEFDIWDPVGNPTLGGLVKTPFTFRKYFDKTRTDRSDKNAGSDENDCVIMRYAEVLLNFAEAENEVNGPTKEVYDAINQVRGRKSVEMPPLPAGLNKDQMREAIRHERRVELAFECGSRFFDLKRWGIMEETLNGFVTGIDDFVYVYEPHYDLWPIPQGEIDIYAGHGLEYGQNPGY